MPATPPARARLLATATRLFYAEGVHTVGIDRIIAESGVAKATFYHHFPSKDLLVGAYVEEQSQRQRAAALRASARATDEPTTALVEYFVGLAEAGASPDYRGCPIINVGVEYPNPEHPVRQAIDAHRRWFREHFRGLLAGAKVADPARTADLLMLLRDGLLVGLDMDAPGPLRVLIREAVAGIVGQAPSGKRRNRSVDPRV